MGIDSIDAAATGMMTIIIVDTSLFLFSLLSLSLNESPKFFCGLVTVNVGLSFSWTVSMLLVLLVYWAWTTAIIGESLMRVAFVPRVEVQQIEFGR